MPEQNDNIPPWMQGWTSYEEQAERDAKFVEEHPSRRIIPEKPPASLVGRESADAPQDDATGKTTKLITRNENDIRRYNRIAGYALRLTEEWRESDREDLLHETHLEDKIEHCSRILAKITARSIERMEDDYPDYGMLLSILDRPEMWCDRISDEMDKRELERRRREYLPRSR